MNPGRFLLLGAACLLSLAASAQWQWIDNAGRKVFSDRAPPADILEKNILNRPVVRSPKTENSSLPGNSALTAPASAPTTSMPQDAANAPKLGGVDKELADKKKKASEAEAAKRKLEQENNLKARIDNCARAKQSKINYESGMRMARTNEKGEREVLDDATRGAELKRIQAIINSDCQ
jgi:hypothetical protein